MNDYSLIFERNEGPITVEVRFKGEPKKSINNRKAIPSDIMGLIDPATGLFLTQMLFDDHPHNIYEIRINTEENRVKIYAESGYKHFE